MPATAQQEIEWLEIVHDYGIIEENDGPAKCQLRFVNRGNKPVAIIKASASCGCTEPQYSTTPVEPGDTGIVNVTYDPAGRPGKFDKKVKIETTDGESENLRSNLRVRGVVSGNSATVAARYPYEAGKARLRATTVIFGELTKNRRKAVSIEAYNITHDTITPSWENLPEYINVRSIGPSIAPGEFKTYTFFFDGMTSPQYGIVTDKFQFRANPGDETVEIESVANVKEDFERLTPGQRANAPTLKIEPEIVDFGEFSRNSKPITRTFEIKNMGKDPLIIRRLYTADKGVTATIQKDKIKKGKHTTVTVTVDPSQLPSEMLNARITVINNDPALSTQVVRISGLVK